jgi:hypothetical protein
MLHPNSRPWPETKGIMHLTYRDSDPHISSVSPESPGETGAPVKESEITPEMVDIGVKIIRTYFDQPNDWFTRAIVEEILSDALEYGR